MALAVRLLRILRAAIFVGRFRSSLPSSAFSTLRFSPGSMTMRCPALAFRIYSSRRNTLPGLLIGGPSVRATTETLPHALRLATLSAGPGVRCRPRKVCPGRAGVRRTVHRTWVNSTCSQARLAVEAVRPKGGRYVLDQRWSTICSPARHGGDVRRGDACLDETARPVVENRQRDDHHGPQCAQPAGLDRDRCSDVDPCPSGRGSRANRVVELSSALPPQSVPRRVPTIAPTTMPTISTSSVVGPISMGVCSVFVLTGCSSTVLFPVRSYRLSVMSAPILAMTMSPLRASGCRRTARMSPVLNHSKPRQFH